MRKKDAMADKTFARIWNSFARLSDFAEAVGMTPSEATQHAHYLRRKKGLALKRYQSGSCEHTACEDYHTDTQPEQPTRAMPGSKAKVEEMRRRVERDEMLTHPDDATFEDYRKGVDEVPPGCHYGGVSHSPRFEPVRFYLPGES